MSTEKATSPSAGAVPDHIDAASDQSVAEWAKKLDSTEMQIRDAVAEVGTLATDVEMHLKGTRSTTNVERVEEAGGAG
ncbi:DUF3606 domain-containing protein [Xylophilus sp. Kf1]|nr:DUF3606 domain-containing protein [Xylophilus sp. Kf1]